MLTIAKTISACVRLITCFTPQIICPSCHTYKKSHEFQYHSVCRSCQSEPPASLLPISTRVDPSSFRRTFDHEPNRGARLNDFQRSGLVILWALNLPVEHISQLTGCEPRTITITIDRFNDTGSLDDLPRSGAPRHTTSEEDQLMLDFARQQKFVTPRMVATAVRPSIARRSIRRRLDEAGLGGRIARTEQPFTSANKESRVDFAREHETWDDHDWDRVIFGDESYIMLGINGQVWVQRPVNTAYDPEYMLPGKMAHPPKVGVFACFTSQGVGGLRFIDDDMDGRMYTETMQRTMKPSALAAFPSGGWKYLHDNAPYHTAEDSRIWFHNNGIDCIKLPPYSPDLNPIENLFFYWKRKVELRFPHNLTELREFCAEEWEAIPPIKCSMLVASMHDRMLAVINAGGHMTGY